jgi:hypothetical protein
MASAKYFPRKGDVVDGALKLLETILRGELARYPTVTLKLAGIEANATKMGYPEVKEALHRVVKAIRSAVEEAGLKKRGMGFEDVEIPPEVQQKYMPVVQEVYNFLMSMKENRAKEEIAEVMANA